MEDILGSLDNLVGLSRVKEMIYTMINQWKLALFPPVCGILHSSAIAKRTSTPIVFPIECQPPIAFVLRSACILGGLFGAVVLNIPVAEAVQHAIH